MAKDAKDEKTAPDWEAIEDDYKSSPLSVRELARKHGVPEATVRSTAKKRNWSRPLEGKIVLAAKNAAAAVDPVTGQISAHPDVVASAVQRTADVIVGHRRDLADLAALERQLAKELRQTKMGVSDRARSLKALSDARSKRILVEREVWGLANFKSEADVESALRSEGEKLTAEQLDRIIQVIDAR